jgi:tetratricopeptide (TPR) repeat protein
MKHPATAFALLAGLASMSCTAGTEGLPGGPTANPTTDRNYLRDDQGRYLSLHGVNTSGDAKVPYWITVDGVSRPYRHDDLRVSPLVGVPSFVGRPFPLDPGWKPGDGTAAMDAHLGRVRQAVREMRDAGFDSIRLVIMWEGVEPVARGVYDLEYLHYLRRVVEICGEFRVWVLLDFHQDMISRYLTVRFNDRPTVTRDGVEERVDPFSVENQVLALFPPYTDAVRGDGMPRWAVHTALPEKDMRPENPWWGTPRTISGFSPAMLCKAYGVYQWVSGEDPDPLVGFACGKVDPDSPDYDPFDGPTAVCNTIPLLSDEDLDPWLKKLAAYACSDPTPQFAPYQSTDQLPFSQWSIVAWLSLDVDRVSASFFSDRVLPGLYARECRDPDKGPHDLFGCRDVILPTHPVCRDPGRETWEIEAGGAHAGPCKDVRVEYYSVRDYLQEAYVGAWLAVIDALKVGEAPANGPDTRPVLPSVIGYDVINEPVGNVVGLLLANLPLLAGVDRQALADLAKGFIGDPKTAQAIADLVPALRLVPDLPPLPDEPTAPTPPEPPDCTDLDPDVCDVRTTLYRIDLDAYEDALAAYDAAMAAYPDALAAAEAERAATLRLWGLEWDGPPSADPADTGAPRTYRTDLAGLWDFATLFDYAYLRPFHGRVGRAILKADPDAVLFLGGSLSLGEPLGGIIGPTRGIPTPDGLEGRVVWTPHFYTDIYPFVGFNQPARDFQVDELAYRDYTEGIRGNAQWAIDWMGNAPVVFGEFGSYFNFGGIEKSIARAYDLTAHILDNNYEAYESLFLSRMVWCLSLVNDTRYGDFWNKEDFSIRGPAVRDAAGDVVDFGPWRAAEAWARPHARAMAGIPVATHYRSPLHYFDSEKGIVDPVGEFYVRYKAKETTAPTEIQIPRVPIDGVDADGNPTTRELPYPDGFYVWLSDGTARYDPERSILYHHPADDAPGVEHWVRILPPLPGNVARGWQYFFQGDRVVAGETGR